MLVIPKSPLRHLVTTLPFVRKDMLQRVKPVPNLSQLPFQSCDHIQVEVRSSTTPSPGFSLGHSDLRAGTGTKFRNQQLWMIFLKVRILIKCLEPAPPCTRVLGKQARGLCPGCPGNHAFCAVQGCRPGACRWMEEIGRSSQCLVLGQKDSVRPWVLLVL